MNPNLLTQSAFFENVGVALGHAVPEAPEPFCAVLGLCFSTTLSASFRFRAGASPAMCLAYPLAFEGRGSAL